MTAAGLRGTGTAAHRRSGAASRRRWPNDRMERALVAEGFDSVGGLDEVGRGAWAGPVSVGVVVIPVGRRAPKGLCDSKLLTEEQREALFPSEGISGSCPRCESITAIRG